MPSPFYRQSVYLNNNSASASSTTPPQLMMTTSFGDESVEVYQQCDYGILFSHLPMSFQFGPILQSYTNALGKYGLTSAPSSSSPAFTTTTPYNQQQAMLDSQLLYQQQSNYKLISAVVCLLFGFFFAVAGYRLLKLSMFIIGFFLSTSIVYLILSEQKQLSLIENLVISLSIGVLFAFVALLVQYIGLFLLGITSSTAIVTCILIFIDLFYTNNSAWLCIGLLFLCATIVASFSLKFQKAFSIINTSCIGSALLMIAIDFVVENNLLLEYICELFRVNGSSFNIFQRQKTLYKFSYKDHDEFTSTSTSTSTSTVASKSSSTTTKSPLRNLILTSSSSSSTNSIISKLAANLTTNNPLFSSMSSSSISSSPTSTTISSTITNSTNGIINQDIISSESSKNGALALFLKLYTSAHARLCWYTWLIFGSFFVLFITSLLIQCLVTAKNYDHRDTWQKRMQKNFFCSNFKNYYFINF